MMVERLIHALIRSENEAADDTLLEALNLGNEPEQARVLDALLRRQSVRGLSGVVGAYEALADPMKLAILSQIRLFHSALRECGRSDDHQLRRAAMKLIAIGRQGRLSYVLSENLNHAEETLSRPAVEALVALARWVSTQTRSLHTLDPADRAQAYEQVIAERPEIEQAVARAMDIHRGRHGAELMRAALLLCDWPGSKTLAILHTAKHGGQSAMVRRLQQPPAAEHVEAFLLGASHGGLRTHFGAAFSHIDEAPVLDALLRKTHWLKDGQLQACMKEVTRGTWWGDGELAHDIERRTPGDAAGIGEWLGVSGVHDVVQDERMNRLREHAAGDFTARLRLLRVALQRPRGASVSLIRAFLSDSDERLVRLAAREIIRRKPRDFENMLLQLMTSAPESVRRVISRSLGQAGFDHFWKRFDQLPRPTRKAAGRAMLKILPDVIPRLTRRLISGAQDQRIKALQITQELGLSGAMRDSLKQLCADPNARIRSKAVCVVAQEKDFPLETLVERVLRDTDARVRANAIEALENRITPAFLPLLVQRARAANNRERANAIKALHSMRISSFSTQLAAMLRDERPEHRISALWVLRHIGWWQLLPDAGDMAKGDPNLRVRRYALGVLKTVADIAGVKKGTMDRKAAG